MPDSAQWQSHFAAGLIGRPYRAQACGPDAFDCWGLASFVWRTQIGLVVPDVRLDAANAFRDVMNNRAVTAAGVAAVPVSRPREFDAVYMTSRDLPHHVGVWVTPDPLGGVLHAIQDAGVVYQRPASLAAHGLSIVKFLRLKAA